MLDRRGLWNLCNLLTENNQHVVLTEEQKGHKLCSFVLMSKVICLHVSRVSARIEVNGQQSTVNGPIRMVVGCL